EITQEATADLHQVDATMQQLQDSATAGQNIVDAMQRAFDSKLQPDLDALDRLVPKPASPAPGNAANASFAKVTILSGPAILLPAAAITQNRQALTVAVARADPAKLPLVVQQRSAVADLTNKWQSMQALRKAAPVELATSQRVEHDLGEMFRGRS